MRRPFTGRPAQTRHDNDPHWSRAAASRSDACVPALTAMTRPCSHPPWTSSTTSDRCPRTSPCTSTPATTRPRPETYSPSGTSPVTSHTGATKHPSGQISVGMANAPTPGTTHAIGDNAATNAAASTSSTPSASGSRPCTGPCPGRRGRGQPAMGGHAAGRARQPQDPHRAAPTRRSNQRLTGGGARPQVRVWGRPKAWNSEASWKPVMAWILSPTTTSTMTP